LPPDQAPAASPPRLEFRIRSAGSHLLRARERLRDYLGLYCAQRDVVDDVVLCVEEACTNAIRHSGSSDDITIALEFVDERLVAVVTDRGCGFDADSFAPALPDLMADHGRGLYIIASLMDDIELRCDGGCQVRMARWVAPRCAASPMESGLGEVRASDGPGQHETRLRAMLEEIDEAFVAVDWEYRCVHANGTALQLAGKPLDELLGRQPWELFPGLTGTALERAYRDAMELGRSATRDGRLVYCNAGHPASVVARPEGDVALLPATSPLIGAFEDFEFRNAEAHLSCEDLLFLYTDGLTDARDGRRLFGEERLFDVISATCPGTPDEMVARVVESVVEFAGEGLRDDLAVLALRRHEPPGPSQQKLRLG
jgi:PAS domain S-box-containing protein